MRDLKCVVCGDVDRITLYESTVAVPTTAGAAVDPYGAHYRINQCRGCGLRYSSPIFDAQEIRALYKHAPHHNIYQGEEANVFSTMKGYYRLARPSLCGHDRFLDIGCDVGLLLDVACQDGFHEIHGVEPNPVAARIAERVPGAIILQRFYEDQEFPDDYFDCISLIHVLDHLVNPAAVLRKAWDELKPGGVILAVVHNVESPLARILGERFPPYNLYHHYFFSPTTLRCLFTRCGFLVVRIAPAYNRYSLGFLVRRIPLVPVRVRQVAQGMLGSLGLGRLHMVLPLGNIGIVARRPPDARVAPSSDIDHIDPGRNA